MSRPKRIITKQEIKEIITAYLAGTSLNNLQKQTRLQKHTLKKLLNNAGIQVLSAYETQKKNGTLEERNYFDELNELQCYVLGAIFGDGCVHYNEKKYKYALTITSNDLDILGSAQTLFGTNFPLKKRKKSNAYNLVVNSKHLCQELICKFYLQSPKSDKLIWPILPELMFPYFVSGLLSTDGCVRIDNRRKNKPGSIEFSYSSNCLSFIKSLQSFLSKILSIPNEGHIKTNKTKRKNKNYSLRYTGTHAKKILDWIYSNTNILTRCQRKYDIYQNYLACVSNSTI